ncbi:IS66-like element accessory protein TnpA [Burkholderia thailandensis]|uniref:IS66-like element accessory protein TnpA n=1 Tax=Burkholderia thailandensis TaxID=57975 RepID=UPI0022ABD101|nr:transposase [Burkholderia thailandensis]MCZ2896160.1 transposase [Burkholderia thailandensis]MCZ2903687.1 transposase [Burkholderia thailandensis]MDD1484657.1 transposase [Burkholderia thailandensis]MDD1490640.1 transposase [Burkholderia thailandensis]MDD1496744.1 transposase [Burkholderia thailandensis]
MEIKAQGRRRGSKNYTNEFRTRVVAETRDPTRSLAEVARAHGLNANLVSKWRRDQEQEATSAAAPVELFLPVQRASPPIPEPVRSSGMVIECRGVRVCFEGKPESDVLRLVLTSLLEVGS